MILYAGSSVSDKAPARRRSIFVATSAGIAKQNRQIYGSVQPNLAVPQNTST